MKRIEFDRREDVIKGTVKEHEPKRKRQDVELNILATPQDGSVYLRTEKRDA